MHPIVDILTSAPTLNTCSRKWHHIVANPAEHIGNAPFDQQYFFTLPNSLDDSSVVQVVQDNTISYDLQQMDVIALEQWRQEKRDKARKWWMKRIRERAELLKKLKRELQICHKMSWTENGFPGVRWWLLDYWGREKWLKVKKEESPQTLWNALAPTYPSWDNRKHIPHIKIETPPSPSL